MNTNPIELTIDGAVAVVTFNRPDAANAFNTAMYNGLRDALQTAKQHDDVAVVLLRAVGRHFCAGQDLDEMAELAAGRGTPDMQRAFPSLLDTLQAFPLPMVAAVRGAAVGLGMTMLAHVDLVVVADDARLRAPFAPMGVPPEAGSSVTLALAMGPQRAAEALFTGRFLTGVEAAAAGLALRSVAADEVESVARSLADEVAAHPVAALRAIKAAVLAGRVDAIVAARQREEAAFAELLASFNRSAVLPASPAAPQPPAPAPARR
jgi:enoyl-CoA hydratase/carnithine racemase